MEKSIFENAVIEFTRNDSENYVTKEIALRPELAGLQIYEDPIFGYAAASDPLFAQLKQPGIIGDHFILPEVWLDGARTVISVFLPYTQAVKKANAIDMSWPADEWLHARIEGQGVQSKISHFAIGLLEKEGFAVLMPTGDSRFLGRNPNVQDKNVQAFYTSNWSERHVAHVCGLGTFGLSKGLITAKGVAGRYFSLVTTAPFEPTLRRYTKYDEYCIYCGDCVRNCPMKAISLEEGKKHPPCSAFLDRVRELHKPRYGCGKCQVKVACDNGIPLPGGG